MRIRSFLPSLVIVAALAACTDGPTATNATPVVSDKQVSLITATIADTITEQNSANFLIGSTAVDTVKGLIDQQYFGYSADELSRLTMINGSEKVSFGTSSFQFGLTPSETKGVSFQITSDWQPVDADKHRGISGSATTDFIFLVEKYKLDLKTGRYEFASNRATAVTKKSGNASATIDLPPEKDALYFVYVTQRYALGCLGNDSIGFTSKIGMITKQTDQYGSYTAQARKIRQSSVNCSLYSSADAAKAANAALRLSGGRGIGKE